MPAAAPRRFWIAAGAALATVWLGLVVRFWFVCDDAFISFRYADNLSRGLGLTWDPADLPAVEGYSNLLWVLWLALGNWLGIAPEALAPVTSALCGLLLLVWVPRFLLARGSSPAAATAAMALLALAPPFAVWSTGGLETMAATLLGWACFAWLLGDRSRPRGLAAAAAGLGWCLLRPEATVLVALLLVLAAMQWRRHRNQPLGRAVLLATLLIALGLAAQLTFRLSWHGDWLPHTVRTKGGFAWFRIERGLCYLGSFLLTFPGVALAAALGTRALAAAQRSRGLATVALLLMAAQAAYAVRVGGDFMAMGRFLVPALPFAALLLGLGVDRLRRQWAGGAVFAVVALCALGNLPAAFDRYLVPKVVRDQCDFRWGRPQGETEWLVWRQLRDGARDDAILARALDQHTKPGELLIREAIGVVGYRSHLRVLDTFGLVTRMPEADHTWLPFTTPGHDRYLPWNAFLPRRPDCINAHLAPPDAPMIYPMLATPFERSALRDQVEVLHLPVAEKDIEGRVVELRLFRFTRWDDPLAPLAELLPAVADIAPADPAAEPTLQARLPADAAARVAAALTAALQAGHLAAHGAGPFRYGRIADPQNRSHGFALEATVQQGPGLAHDLPRGKLLYAVTLDGTPRIDGRAPGWIAVPPAQGHRDTVTGGRALLLHFVPDDAIRWRN